jgi:site-specific DNA recombinase
VFVRENEVLPALDAWLSKEFAPHRIEETIEALAAAEDSTGHHQALVQAHTTIRDCESKMVRYRAAIDADGDLQEITQWINAAKAERLQAEAVLRTMPAPARMSREDVRAMIEQFASLAAVIGSADPPTRQRSIRDST